MLFDLEMYLLYLIDSDKECDSNDDCDSDSDYIEEGFDDDDGSDVDTESIHDSKEVKATDTQSKLRNKQRDAGLISYLSSEIGGARSMEAINTAINRVNRILALTYLKSEGKELTEKSMFVWTKKFVCQKYQLLAWFCDNVLRKSKWYILYMLYYVNTLHLFTLLILLLFVRNEVWPIDCVQPFR